MIYTLVFQALYFVFRDLKLENFLFEGDSSTSPLILIDFGLSKHIDHGERMKQRVGSCYYTGRLISAYESHMCTSICSIDFVVCVTAQPRRSYTATTTIAATFGRWEWYATCSSAALHLSAVCPESCLLHEVLVANCFWRAGKTPDDIHQSTLTKPVTFPERTFKYDFFLRCC
jgi:hypothetical protein